MADLLAGTIVTGTDAPTMASAQENTSQGSITSTSYAAGGNVCGVAFIAPTTGRALVSWRAGSLDNNTGGQDTYLSFELREGSTVGAGTVRVAASDEYAVQHEGVNEIGFGSVYPVDGLTPGASYNVRTMHRVTGGSGTVDDRQIIVQPLP